MLRIARYSRVQPSLVVFLFHGCYVLINLLYMYIVASVLLHHLRHIRVISVLELLESAVSLVGMPLVPLSSSCY